MLAGLDEIYEQAAQARRALKAAIGGRKAPAVRPGGLRDKVLAHLDEHPDKEFTPHESTRCSATAPGRSPMPWTPWSSSAMPRWPPRSRAGSAGPPSPAGAAPEAGNADSAEQDSTDLAGAA